MSAEQPIEPEATETEIQKIPALELIKHTIHEIGESMRGIKADNPTGYEIIRKGLQTARELRGQLKRKGLELKKPAQNYVKSVKSAVDEMTEMLLAIEAPNKIKKSEVDDAKEKIKQEKADAARKEIKRIGDIIAKINDLGRITIALTISDVRERIETLNSIVLTDCDLGDRLTEAKNVLRMAMLGAQASLDGMVKQEKEQAEIKRKAEEQAKREKEQSEKDEALKAERKQFEADKAAEQAKRDKEQSDKDAKLKAEQDQLALDKAAFEAQRKRESDRAELVITINELSQNLPTPLTVDEVQAIADSMIELGNNCALTNERVQAAVNEAAGVLPGVAEALSNINNAPKGLDYSFEPRQGADLEAREDRQASLEKLDATLAEKTGLIKADRLKLDNFGRRLSGFLTERLELTQPGPKADFVTALELIEEAVHTCCAVEKF